MDQKVCAKLEEIRWLKIWVFLSQDQTRKGAVFSYQKGSLAS